MAVRKCTRLLLVIIIFVANFCKIEGQQLFFTNFLNTFNYEDPLFISKDSFDLNLGNPNKNLTRALIRYTTSTEEEQVSHHLHQLFLLGDLTMVVFIDNGHHKLLDLLINDLQLFNKGVTGLIAEIDLNINVASSLRLTTSLYTYAPKGSTINLKEVYCVNGNKKSADNWNMERG